MTRDRPRSTPAAEVSCVVLLCALLAFAIGPVRLGDRRVLVPPAAELDAVQQCLLIGTGMDRLSTAPSSYYDTEVLYPDRNQLRTTEPFLGFVALGLPLRHLLRLSDVDVFEVLRWLAAAASMLYAYFLLKLLGTPRSLSLAGALRCVSHPQLTRGIERLQVVIIPCILACVYHAVQIVSAGRRTVGHTLGIFVSTALYPMCGAINALVAVLAALFALPWLLVSANRLRKHGRLNALVMPITAA